MNSRRKGRKQERNRPIKKCTERCGDMQQWIDKSILVCVCVYWTFAVNGGKCSRNANDLNDSWGLFSQGIPGIIGPPGPAGRTGDKVCLIHHACSISHCLLSPFECLRPFKINVAPVWSCYFSQHFYFRETRVNLGQQVPQAHPESPASSALLDNLERERMEKE